MSDSAPDRFPRLAPILLIGVLVTLAIIRPGNLAGRTGLDFYCSTFLAVATVAYVAWRFHGIFPAALAIVLLRISESEISNYEAFVERASDSAFLATLAIAIAACSRQGKAGRLPWILLAIAGSATAYLGWYGWELPTPIDEVARDRLRHVSMVLIGLAILIGLLARQASWLDRLRLLAVVVLLPVAGVLAAKSILGQWPRLFEGGDWQAVFPEWRQAISTNGWERGSWIWSVPVVVVVLVLTGLWRTLVRGRKEWRNGRPPLAWLLTVAALGSFAAIGARPLAAGSLALAGLGAILCVFGIADLILALVERIELRPPEPGPSNVPRVA